MKSRVLIVMVSVLLLLFFTGCEDNPTKDDTPEALSAIYVLNSAATSISVIDLENNEVYNDVVTVGTWPSHILYRNEKLYVVNSGSNNVMIFNANSWETETPIPLGDGQNPMVIAFLDDIYAWVTCSMSNKVLKVNVASKTVEKRIDAGVGATGLAITQGKVYVANTGYAGWGSPYLPGTVSVIDAVTGDSLTTISVGTNPQDIAIDANGKLHVTCTGNYGDIPGVVSVIDPASDAVVRTIAIGGTPGKISISKTDNLGYISVWGMGCYVYNTETYAIVNGPDNMFLGKGGSGLLADNEGNVWVSVWDDDQVVKVSKEGTILATYDVGDSPMNLEMRLD